MIADSPKERRDLLNGRAYLYMAATMPLKLIANVAGVTEAQVLRLIQLVKRRDK